MYGLQALRVLFYTGVRTPTLLSSNYKSHTMYHTQNSLSIERRQLLQRCPRRLSPSYRERLRITSSSLFLRVSLSSSTDSYAVPTQQTIECRNDCLGFLGRPSYSSLRSDDHRIHAINVVYSSIYIHLTAVVGHGWRVREQRHGRSLAVHTAHPSHPNVNCSRKQNFSSHSQHLNLYY